jgi:hypothetical protein
MKATCEAFGSNSEDVPAAWIEEYVEASFTQHLSELETAASVRNGKTNDKRWNQ